VVNEDQDIIVLVQDIVRLSNLLEANGRSPVFFTNAVRTLTETPKGEEKWLECLERICRCAAMASYGDFTADEEKLLHCVIDQGLSIREKLGFHGFKD
jgi:hypothetical protein